MLRLSYSSSLRISTLILTILICSLENLVVAQQGQGSGTKQPTSTTGARQTTSPVSPKPTPTPSPNAQAQKPKPAPIGKGALAAIIVGCLAFVASMGVLIVLLWRRNKSRRAGAYDGDIEGVPGPAVQSSQAEMYPQPQSRLIHDNATPFMLQAPTVDTSSASNSELKKGGSSSRPVHPVVPSSEKPPASTSANSSGSSLGAPPAYAETVEGSESTAM